MAADAVATGLPQVTLQPGSTITVSVDDAGSIVTSLAVKVFQVLPPGATQQAASAAPILLRRSGV